MGFWSFKITDQKQHPDKFGKEYVYDNRHSMRVEEGDEFIYEKKSGQSRLQFVGTGKVSAVRTRSPKPEERLGGRVNCIYTAVLANYRPFPKEIDISYSKSGRRTRASLGIENLNQVGLSRSVAKLSQGLFFRITEEGRGWSNIWLRRPHSFPPPRLESPTRKRTHRSRSRTQTRFPMTPR